MKKNWDYQIQELEEKETNKNISYRNKIKKEADKIYISLNLAKKDNERLKKKIISQQNKKEYLAKTLTKLQKILELIDKFKTTKEIGKDTRIFNLFSLRKLEFSGAEKRRALIDANESRIQQMAEEEQIFTELKLKILDFQCGFQKHSTQNGPVEIMEEIIKTFTENK
ncbi:unnamed protein product [Moneuplotes crassus]|uniref:Uncharacterized protein n=1 Tax=Euplotes crassus TaxID=5936 RepID=A0AAD1XAJ5_EUPCR|nr:unnamed protein product [Moneuplotes crassus]